MILFLVHLNSQWNYLPDVHISFTNMSSANLKLNTWRKSCCNFVKVTIPPSRREVFILAWRDCLVMPMPTYLSQRPVSSYSMQGKSKSPCFILLILMTTCETNGATSFLFFFHFVYISFAFSIHHLMLHIQLPCDVHCTALRSHCWKDPTTSRNGRSMQ